LFAFRKRARLGFQAVLVVFTILLATQDYSLMSMFRVLAAFSFTMGALLLAGCGDGSPTTYPVTGVVKHNGSLVEGAIVSFVPTDAESQTATATTDATGKYSLAAMPGGYKVSVTKYEGGSPPAASGSGSAASADGEMPADYTGASDAPAPVYKNLLPAKYASVETSGLTATVGSKAETLDFNLEGQ
jgi:hypothetical protein